MPEELKNNTRYEIGPTIGHGGMGVVMSAQQPAIRRQVAIKVMMGAEDTNSRLRFIEEAQITGQLQHPNILPVHDLTLNEHGSPFYTMKLVQGITLQRGLPLEDLHLDGAPLASLEGLDKMPLKRLDIIANRVTRLESLAKNNQLQELYANNTGITDLIGLEGLSLRSLRQHPRLSHIDYNDQGYRPVAEVWALLEARKKKSSASSSGK